ncbi:hypothetical protein [Fructobacillus parabroussonetiae]|uniref:Uncharacterized protein n=1 Tax=Fructobacillus parabroussonetiae TaxID=2713174 RepID=A0ABS5QYY1_9LACO|nr:hypothetical protein [Fructobacillus parabroussonetiae]MBS9337850.1 hypothetical protein [Fructobacillus parabroussonetiae]MCK8617621.1 hypothetical protein [Fructobacillus parabroussonetiae]
MAILHTLGPAETDANLVANHLKDEDPHYQNVTIQLHPDFASIYAQLTQYRGDYFLVPVGYQGPAGDSWTSQHYAHWQELTIQKTWAAPTMEMLLVENTEQKNGKAVSHKTTTALLQDFAKQEQRSLTIDYVPAKPLAADAFLKGLHQYAIFSQNAEQKLQAKHQIIARFQPEMIWCLYQIK